MILALVDSVVADARLVTEETDKSVDVSEVVRFLKLIVISSHRHVPLLFTCCLSTVNG